MANTYTQLYVQIVFAVKGRQNLIKEGNRENLEKYICGIITNKRCKTLAIYCNPDHIHIFVGIHPNVSISELTRDIKSNSSKWINENNWMKVKFNWQEGFGAFTYAKSQKDVVVKYVLNQPIHHRKTSFKEEYISLLDKFDVEYDDKYLFVWD